jgi:CTP:molybdopterin cytidylyltransferase MocA
VNVNVLILAAGKSIRMGRDKAFLPFDQQMNFLDNIVKSYGLMHVHEILVVVNSENADKINMQVQKSDSNVGLSVNRKAPDERFVSIQTGLGSFQKLLPCFIHNIDNPFVNRSVITQMFDQLPKPEWIKPTYEGQGGHPVLINMILISKLMNEKESNLNFREYLSDFHGSRVLVDDPRVLINLNFPDQFDQYFK